MSGWTVFLDRDGVLNRAPAFALLRWRDFEWLSGALDGMRLLNRADVRLCLATNQPAVGLRLLGHRGLARIHAGMVDDLVAAGARLDRIEYAWQPLPNRRRKPRPGMLEDGAAALVADGWDVDPERSFMVGDKVRDMQAGTAFGATCVLIAPDGQAESLRGTAERAGAQVSMVAADLKAAAQWMVARMQAA